MTFFNGKSMNFVDRTKVNIQKKFSKKIITFSKIKIELKNSKDRCLIMGRLKAFKNIEKFFYLFIAQLKFRFCNQGPLDLNFQPNLFYF